MFPKFANWLQKKGVAQFTPEESIKYLKDLTEEIISRRKAKKEVRQ